MGDRIFTNRTRTTVALGALLFLRALSTALQADDPSGQIDEAFFEKKIRPVLIERCHGCHSATGKQQGNLRLDHPQGWLDGGDSGPAIVPGKPEESLLLKAVRYDADSYQMPPDEKLPDNVVADIASWIASGAPAPAMESDPSARSSKRIIDLSKEREFWSYQPPRRHPHPSAVDHDWSTDAIDLHVRHQLSLKGLEPNPAADRAALLRRISFDLTGLPPTLEELDAFANDSHADAYERAVDRLLASPRFAERFGRHWLDVVRYGESLTLRGFIFPEAWRYRDYVIDAMAEDRPYDEFVREHIAGDLMSSDNLNERQRRVVATTFWMLGNTNLEEQDKKQLEMDVIDEQLDVMGKAFMGQTLGCARCHDHKFDPIPTRDYYALAGILKSAQALDHENVSKWKEVPLPLSNDENTRFTENETAIASLESQTKILKEEITKLVANGQGGSKPSAIVAARDLPGIVVDDSQAKKVGVWQASTHAPSYVGEGYIHDQNGGRGSKTVVFTPELPADGSYEVRLAYTHGTNRASNAKATVFSADGEATKVIDQREAPGLDGHFVSLGTYRCEAKGQNFVILSNEDADGHVIADAVQWLPVQSPSPDTAKTAESPNKTPEQLAAEQKIATKRESLTTLEAELKQRRDPSLRRPKVMTIVEQGQGIDCAICVRGSVHAQGAIAPRGFLQVVGNLELPTAMPTDQSGRLQLAQWITSPQHPLTARVMVNRVWHWLFGQGLVRTTDNFGTTGELPSHPELLDELTLDFMEDGWSIKRLVRRIVLSRTYRSRSANQAASAAIDPENRLLWRVNRRRLEAEEIRDSILALGQGLDLEGRDPKERGATFPAKLESDFGFVDGSRKRSIYLPAFRNAVPDVLKVFDAADSSLPTGARNVSTVAPQALFLTNSPWVRQQATAMARRILDVETKHGSPDEVDRERLSQLFRHALGREGTPAEYDAMLPLVANRPPSEQLPAWTDVCHALLASIDFRTRD
jgi:cytochrome c553